MGKCTVGPGGDHGGRGEADRPFFLLVGTAVHSATYKKNL